MNSFVVLEVRGWLLLVVLLVLAGLAVGAWLWLRRRRRRADAALREQVRTEAEREATAKRNRMLIRLDHELKNPLTALRTSAATVREAVGDGAGAPPEMLPAVRQIDSSSRRVARLLADLRKLADVESRQLDYRRVDTDRLIHQAVEDARTAPGAEDRMIVATVARAPWKLPDVAGEEDLLLSAVLNLLGNALKYSADTDVVELRANEQVIDGYRWVVIEVADTGAGIPVDEQEGVWEELSRGARVRSVAGSGMGLSLVRAIIARHGGSVELFSQEGVGTSVRVLLPVLADDPAREAGAQRAGEQVAPPRSPRDAQRAGRILGTPRRTSKRRLQMVDGQLRDTTTGETFGAPGHQGPGEPSAPSVPVSGGQGASGDQGVFGGGSAPGARAPRAAGPAGHERFAPPPGYGGLGAGAPQAGTAQPGAAQAGTAQPGAPRPASAPVQGTGPGTHVPGPQGEYPRRPAQPPAHLGGPEAPADPGAQGAAAWPGAAVWQGTAPAQPTAPEHGTADQHGTAGQRGTADPHNAADRRGPADGEPRR
ncbi:histidine kinase [Brevibacterium sp. 5221]|uniref:Sensor-like histidine kinase SenX3 n=1 Tax=Brevibacterium rongguiense TaxID=2695267 RepID=A0A6N9H878_9MICO|nr:HAMP domain-containing sensor histidine kinase [Brevibacterium rongguiense]MYM20267.1 histidine kinase [Brevibacterium rongguiense]